MVRVIGSRRRANGRTQISIRPRHPANQNPCVSNYPFILDFLEIHQTEAEKLRERVDLG
jgi:hypothetical protein